MSIEAEGSFNMRVYLVPDDNGQVKNYYFSRVIDIEMTEHFICIHNGYTFPTCVINRERFSHFIVIDVNDDEDVGEHEKCLAR